MALCVYEHGNTTIRNGSEALVDCPGYVLLDYNEYVSLTTQSQLPLGLPPLSMAEASQLASLAFVLWAVSYLWVRLQDVT